MKKFFGFGSSTPPPPAPPSRPPTAPAKTAPKTPAAPTIVGRWQEPNGNDTTEFRADGSVIEKPAGGETIRGRYGLEGSKLKIKLDAVAEEIVFSAVLSMDTLELKDRDGQTTRYRRVG